MIRAHKIALDPNNKQATYFAKAAGVARFAYNWALENWKAQYLASRTDSSVPKPTQLSLRRQLNAIKPIEFPWMLEVTKCAPQMAIIQLGQAFENFWAGTANYPQFRRKGKDDRFTLTNDQFTVEDCRIRIPRLGWVRMRESLRFKGKILSATISRKADRWFVSIVVDIQEDLSLPKAENQGAVGVDLGVKALATLSNGEVVVGPKPLKHLKARIRLLSKGLSRKQKGSSNRKKAKIQLAKAHARIAHIRQDALHKLTSYLSSRFHTIGIEDLNVRGMLKNRRLSRPISDMGLYEFRRQLDYKVHSRGGLLVVADRFYPSSKTCSVCGNKIEELSLSTRDWICPHCGTHLDRDVNAAINLEKMAVSSTASACGEVGSGHALKSVTKPTSAKQETSIRFNQK